MEKWYTRRVRGNGSVYGEIAFRGKIFEPTTPHGFIVIGDQVQVRRITDFMIAVRKIGGEEIWTED